MTKDTSPRILKTVNLTCEILQALKETDQSGVTELAEELNLSKGAVYNHLATLQENGLVVKEGTEYKLGLRLMNFGEYVKNRSIVFREGKQETEEIAAETGEYAHLMALQNGEGIHIHRAEGEKAVGDEYYHQSQADIDPLYYSATGKAALAFLDESEVEKILNQVSLTPITENTITDRYRLLDELAQIREQGFALNDEEQFLGLRAVGSPILDTDNQVLGAISVSGPASRISEERFKNALPKKIKEVSNIISINIKQARVMSD